jgi:hypothetical protein
LAAEVAFHGSGLNYSGEDESRIRVLKKVSRSVLTIRRVFGPVDMEIHFVTPKASLKLTERLKRDLSRLEELCAEMEWNCRVQLLANEHFEREILDPVLGLADRVADTSELFLRSVQLAGIRRKGLEGLRDKGVSHDDTPEESERLDISLVPSDAEKFKEALLERPRAKIVLHFEDGSTEVKGWNAEKFTRDSNLMNNIRSKSYLRPGYRNISGKRVVRATVELEESP